MYCCSIHRIHFYGLYNFLSEMQLEVHCLLALKKEGRVIDSLALVQSDAASNLPLQEQPVVAQKTKASLNTKSKSSSPLRSQGRGTTQDGARVRGEPADGGRGARYRVRVRQVRPHPLHLRQVPAAATSVRVHRAFCFPFCCLRAFPPFERAAHGDCRSLSMCSLVVQQCRNTKTSVTQATQSGRCTGTPLLLRAVDDDSAGRVDAMRPRCPRWQLEWLRGSTD